MNTILEVFRTKIEKQYLPQNIITKTARETCISFATCQKLKLHLKTHLHTFINFNFFQYQCSYELDKG